MVYNWQNGTASHNSMLVLLVWQLAMGWLRLAGPLKLQVSFAEYHLFYTILL